MVGRVDGDVVVFKFEVEVEGEGEGRKEVFEWRKVKKGVVGEGAGFRLFWFKGGEQVGKEEMVAMLVSTKTLKMVFVQLYSLEFVGAGLMGEPGERWAVVVQVTAARLWF